MPFKDIKNNKIATNKFKVQEMYTENYQTVEKLNDLHKSKDSKFMDSKA